MTIRKLILVGVCSQLVFGVLAFAQGNSQGHGKGHNKQQEDQSDSYRYYPHRKEIYGWYSESKSNLPPGLAKKDRLPPGLEKKLVRDGTLPPGLERRLSPVPVELVRRLPPPPPDCEHVFISGRIVLLNRKSNLIVDVLAFSRLRRVVLRNTRLLGSESPYSSRILLNSCPTKGCK